MCIEYLTWRSRGGSSPVFWPVFGETRGCGAMPWEFLWSRPLDFHKALLTSFYIKYGDAGKHSSKLKCSMKCWIVWASSLLAIWWAWMELNIIMIVVFSKDVRTTRIQPTQNIVKFEKENVGCLTTPSLNIVKHWIKNVQYCSEIVVYCFLFVKHYLS